MSTTKTHIGFFGLVLATATISASSGCTNTASGGSGTAGTSGQAGTTGHAGTTGTAGGSGAAGTGTAGASGTAGTGAAGSSPDGGGVAGQGGSHVDGGTDVVSLSAPCAVFAKADQPTAKLSDTGCFDATTKTKLASIVVPYEVNSPLWSDGADKSRGFVIPAGSKIHVKNCATASNECMQGPADTGKWVMPVGTVMIKNFGLDGKLIETRLLMHPDATTWNGYSYAWNEEQTEATVVPNDDDPSLDNMRKKVTFNTGKTMVTWSFPYRFDCNGCHTMPAGGTLGPETRQMNRMVGGMNQIDRWRGLATGSLFEGSGPPMPYQAALVLPYSGQLGTVTPNPSAADKAARARSYLHANCSYCHRPDGEFATLDFRYDTALKDVGACGVTPTKSTVGVDGALILKPGKPMESVMWLRMHAPFMNDKIRMPQLATYVLDDLGLSVISDWISSLTACP